MLPFAGISPRRRQTHRRPRQVLPWVAAQGLGTLGGEVSGHLTLKPNCRHFCVLWTHETSEDPAVLSNLQTGNLGLEMTNDLPTGIAWAWQKGSVPRPSGGNPTWFLEGQIPGPQASKWFEHALLWATALFWSGVPLLAFLLRNRHSILPPPSWFNSGWDKLGESHLKQQKIYISPNTYLVNSLCWVQKGYSSRIFKFSFRFKITLPTRACLLGRWFWEGEWEYVSGTPGYMDLPLAWNATTKAILLCHFSRRPLIIETHQTTCQPRVPYYSCESALRFINWLNIETCFWSS